MALSSDLTVKFIFNAVDFKASLNLHPVVFGLLCEAFDCLSPNGVDLPLPRCLCGKAPRLMTRGELLTKNKTKTTAAPEPLRGVRLGLAVLP